MMKNLQLLFDSTTKQARTAPTQVIEEQVKYVGNTDVFSFGFLFMSPKWTRTKFEIEISLSLQAY